MTYNEFEKIVHTLNDVDIQTKKNVCKQYDFFPEKKTKDDILVIYKQWFTGGKSGGSCWDEGEPNYYYSHGNPEPEFDSLDNILVHFCPNITFLQYKVLYSKCVEKFSYTENEYYGNSSDYEIRYVTLQNLYKYLKDNGLFQDEK